MKYKIVITQSDVDKYAEYYFEKHTRARKKPICHPYHPSINTWFVMRRPEMNALKQKWKDFTKWIIEENNLSNLRLNTFGMTFKTYMPTKRRIDPDNTVPKFILDGMIEAGFIVDDDGEHLKSLELCTDYDKENPRTEITIICKD